MGEQLISVTHGEFTYGLVCRDGRVVDAPPAGRRWIGYEVGWVLTELRAAGASVIVLNSERPYRLLVAGSRTWTDPDSVGLALTNVLDRVRPRPLVVVHGACPRGADWLARQWVRWSVTLGWPVSEEAHPADWSAGRGAGFARNTEMAWAQIDECLAFIRDGSAGASHCAGEAELAGAAVHRVPWVEQPHPFAVMWEQAQESAGGTGPLIVAQYHGRCRTCAGRWEPGERIAFDEDEGSWICEDCVTRQA
jgi:hypothetical protein